MLPYAELGDHIRPGQGTDFVIYRNKPLIRYAIFVYNFAS